MVSRKTMSVCALAVAAGTISAAKADTVASLSYQTLSGVFTSTSATTGTFDVFANTAGNAAGLPGGTAGNSTGNVTREPAGGNAAFFSGFYGNIDFSDFQVHLNVTAITPVSALATGTFTATDILGNTITGTISGTWSFGNLPGVQLAFFDATLTNVNYTANAGNLFTGNAATTANMAGLGANLPGSMQITFLQNVPPPIFSVNIPVVSTVVQGQITPTPGALALLGLGGLVAGRRRR